ncbi:hypothetical protein MGYG_09022 [Nannizzia gypsea CBS 118893]|uniref:Uncharacterized protein n=1 Tax=Arthroderma gypseum (strain ATCC MYA-4604 / CBS 118893) TaxID=535722 RepID=E4UT01_ARTGP|nr:hypothetical protein MGYG_09022 [Nannizzia gypsea CBS 118893]EFR00614.1 hypothetical protein MGYG_09022 [Nannizzia gypsea CBS 118893]
MRWPRGTRAAREDDDDDEEEGSRESEAIMREQRSRRRRRRRRRKGERICQNMDGPETAVDRVRPKGREGRGPKNAHRWPAMHSYGRPRSLYLHMHAVGPVARQFSAIPRCQRKAPEEETGSNQHSVPSACLPGRTSRLAGRFLYHDLQDGSICPTRETGWLVITICATP